MASVFLPSDVANASAPTIFGAGAAKLHAIEDRTSRLQSELLSVKVMLEKMRVEKQKV